MRHERIQPARAIAASATGGTATVAGFFFDANEVLVGYKNVDKVERDMTRARRAYDALLAEIRRHKPALEKFAMDYARWQVAIQSVRENPSEIRRALDEEILRTGYRPSR